MKQALLQLAFRAAEFGGMYERFEVDSATDREACIRLLERVRYEELGRIAGTSPLDSAAFEGEQVVDRLLAVRHRRGGHIAGCTRSVRADQLADVPTSRSEYRLDRVDPSLLARTGIATRLAVLPEYRKSSAGPELMRFMFELGLRDGYELCLLACEPGLFPMYERVGFRPLGRAHASGTGGFRIPMVMVCRDREHLEAIGSPLLRSLDRQGADPGAPGVGWYADLLAREGPIETGVTRYVERGPNPRGPNQGEPIHASLTRGMSPESVRQLLRNALTIACTHEQTIARAGDGGRQLGFVLTGILEMRIADRVVAELLPGDAFGEIAWILRGPQQASLVATSPDTRVVLLSQRAPERVDRAGDQAAFWRNLAGLAARRWTIAP